MTAKNKQHSPSSAAQTSQNGFSIISREKLLQIYSTMVKCRMLEERARILARQNKSAAGRGAGARLEAVAAGLGIDLLPEDTVVLSAEDLIPAFIKGVPPDEILRHLASAPANKASVNTGAFAAFNVVAAPLPVGVRLSIATGVALANKQAKSGKVVLVFSSEPGAAGACTESLAFASGRELPIVFVLLGGVRARAGRKPKPGNSRLESETCGLPVITVDRNDAVAVYRVAHVAIAHARRGGGPTLIEAQPFALHGEGLGKQTETEDPILNMQTYLTRKGLYAETLRAEVTDRFQIELDAALSARSRAHLHKQKR